MEVFFVFALPITLLLAGLVIGTFNERRHYRSIRQREAALGSLKILTGRSLPPGVEATEMKLVTGATVVAKDRFKALLAWFRMIFGGRVGSYENLLERGRREAVLRMQEKAAAEGFSLIINSRFSTATIGQGMEVLVYGTAAKLK